MKKLFLSLSFVATAFATQAQNCVPAWPVGAGPGIMPDSATNLPIAHQSEPYNAEVHFKVPLDTTAVLLGNTVDVVIQNITVESVEGLDAIPATTPFTYVTNPSSGVFQGDSLGCVLISGVPSASSFGEYPIVVNVTANATVPSMGGFAVAQPATIDYYKIVVDYGLNATIVDSRNDGLTVFPSATNGTASLRYFLPTASEVIVRVMNNLGQTMVQKSVQAAAGSNESSLDMSAFSNGLYVVSLHAGDNVMTTRVAVSK